MKMIVAVALALVAVAAAAPATDGEAKIVRSEFDQNPEGGYNFAYETENGINRSENGELKEALDEEKKSHIFIAVRGSYSYPGADGKPETVNYYADETGYHAEGDSIPKAVSRR